MRSGVRRGAGERDELAARRPRLLEVPQARRNGPLHPRWSSGTYNDKPMPPTVDPQRVAAVAKHPSAYFGTKGTAVSGWSMNDVRLFPESFMQKVGRPKTVLPRVWGHEADFLEAIRTGGRSSADFDYSARLTEIMLVGNVAERGPREAHLRLPRRQVYQQRQGQRPAETRAPQGLGIRIRVTLENARGDL